MNRKAQLVGRCIGWLGLTTTMLAMLLVNAVTIPAFSAGNTQEAEQFVEKSRFTLEDFISDANMEAFRDLITRAKGICIAPQVLKGAFIIGASGGSGVLLVKEEKTRTWSGPAFYTVGGASFGLQIGGQASEVILLAMTDRGVTALLSNSVKLGADVGVAAGPIGVGVSASSANLSVDILSFSRSKGLYGGVSLDGAVVAVRDSLNEQYYGKKVTPMDILVRRTAKNPHSESLIASVAKATSK